MFIKKSHSGLCRHNYPYCVATSYLTVITSI
jgi:hypothetical protein